jgi:hypothetical protein
LCRHRISTLAASLLPYLLATVLALLLHSPASAAGVTFSVFAKGQQPMMLGVNAISQEDDAIWKKDNQANVLAEEENYYSFITGYIPVAPGTDVNGYSITSNEATLRMNCAGLALMRLIGGPFIMNTGPALLLLQTFARPLADSERTEPWDVVVFMRDGQPQHLALVERGDTPPGSVILSKDGPERIYRGRLIDFPNKSSLGADLKNFGTPVIYRLDWDAIDVRRLDEPEVAVPPGGAKIGGGASARIRKTLIEAADEISSALSMRGYGPHPDQSFPFPIVVWEENASRTQSAAIICADLAPPSSAARKMMKAQIGAGPAIAIPGAPDDSAQRVPDLDIPSCEYVFSCGRHLLSLIWTAPIDATDEKALAEALAVACRSADTMFEILTRRALANGLDKPERPRTNYPYEGATGP